MNRSTFCEHGNNSDTCWICRDCEEQELEERSMGHKIVFPYKPESCPGRPYHLTDGSVGCSLCGTLLKPDVVQGINALIADRKPWVILCLGVRSTFKLIPETVSSQDR